MKDDKVCSKLVFVFLSNCCITENMQRSLLHQYQLLAGGSWSEDQFARLLNSDVHSGSHSDRRVRSATSNMVSFIYELNVSAFYSRGDFRHLFQCVNLFFLFQEQSCAYFCQLQTTYTDKGEKVNKLGDNCKAKRKF